MPDLPPALLVPSINERFGGKISFMTRSQIQMLHLVGEFLVYRLLLTSVGFFVFF